MRIIGYARVSTEEQADSRAGLNAQRAAIDAACHSRNWCLTHYFEDAGLSAATLKRPGITQALENLKQGAADALVVSKLDRLSRSLLDFSMLMETARHQGWNLVALDLGVDTSTPAGEMMANVLATFSQFERRLIGQRTKEALQQKRAEGVRLGRPPALPSAVISQALRLREAGMSYAAIAAALNDEGVPTSQGGIRWHPSTVHAVLRLAQRAAADRRTEQ